MPLAPSKVTRGHRYKLFKKRKGTLGRKFFSARVVDLWNELEDSTFSVDNSGVGLQLVATCDGGHEQGFAGLIEKVCHLPVPREPRCLVRPDTWEIAHSL